MGIYSFRGRVAGLTRFGFSAVAAMSLAVAGCSQSGTTTPTSGSSILQNLGSGLLQFGTNVVKADCQGGANGVGNLINIVASSPEVAAGVATALAANSALTALICPFVAATVTASVGTVPGGTPVGTIPSTKAATAKAPSCSASGAGSSYKITCTVS